MQTLLPRVDRQTSVLDVGAGPGRYALAIAPHVKQVVAVEPDAAMAPLLEAAIREGNASNISIVRATWQEADVEPADVVLCAHVLYPIADAVPFIRKLDDRARHACFLVLRDTMPEPEPLGRLWNQFHGEPRYLQPGYVEAFNLLHEMGIYANVRVSRIPGPTWTYHDLDGAVAAMREHLILPESAGGDAVLRSELREALVSEGEMLRLPAHDTYAAVLWWDKGP